MFKKPNYSFSSKISNPEGSNTSEFNGKISVNRHDFQKGETSSLFSYKTKNSVPFIITLKNVIKSKKEHQHKHGEFTSKNEHTIVQNRLLKVGNYSVPITKENAKKMAKILKEQSKVQEKEYKNLMQKLNM